MQSCQNCLQATFHMGAFFIIRDNMVIIQRGVKVSVTLGYGQTARPHGVDVNESDVVAFSVLWRHISMCPCKWICDEW